MWLSGKLLLMCILALSAAYLAAAYVVLPGLWKHFEDQPGLSAKPMVTTTPEGIPGDPINVGLVGSKTEVVKAFAAVGWAPADAITLTSSVEIGISVLFDRPYAHAPVSTLLHEGRRQDLAFEKPAATSADRRHHVRLWLTLAQGAEARPVWLGAASFDRGVGFSRETGQVTHHIAPDLDAERDLIIRELSAAGLLNSAYRVSGAGPTLAGRNGGGDRYFTDGEVSVGVINADAAARSDLAVETPEDRPLVPTSWAIRRVARWLWNATEGGGKR
jgi:LssY C-terminus